MTPQPHYKKTADSKDSSLLSDVFFSWTSADYPRSRLTIRQQYFTTHKCQLKSQTVLLLHSHTQSPISSPRKSCTQWLLPSPSGTQLSSVLDLKSILMAVLSFIFKTDSVVITWMSVFRKRLLMVLYVQIISFHFPFVPYLLSGEHADSTKIKVKSDALPTRYTKNGLLFSDGTELPCDALVFATGFKGNMRYLAQEIFGDEVAAQMGDFWGLDKYGEIKGAFKPCGRKFLLLCWQN